MNYLCDRLFTFSEDGRNEVYLNGWKFNTILNRQVSLTRNDVKTVKETENLKGKETNRINSNSWKLNDP